MRHNFSIKHLILAIFLFFIFSACSQSTRLEEALDFAGKNRIELQNVLDHYSKNPKDSLKYKAACFLIENMPYHYAYDSERLKKFRSEFYKIARDNNLVGEEAFKLLENKYGAFSYNKLDMIFDSHIITSEYLINNIELSFQSWYKSSWREQITFDDFCEYILPYRVSHEPLEDWRALYYDKYSQILDFSSNSWKDQVIVCQILYDSIIKDKWFFYQANPIPGMGAGILLNDRVGSCSDRSEFATYIMRALGIPGGIDYRLQNPHNTDGEHSWSFVKNSSGKCIEYTWYDQRPLSEPEIKWKNGRVYRKCFGVQPLSLPIISNNKEIPSKLSNFLSRDVTNEYIEGVSLDLDINDLVPDNEFIYLCVFNNKEWIPITWAMVEKGKATFSNVDKGIVYLPAYYENGLTQPVTAPILIDEKGTKRYLTADLSSRQNLALSRKYPIKPWWNWFLNRSVGGKFEGANNIDFKNPTTLYVVTHQLDMKWNKIPINNPSKFRYIRYVSANNGYCNIAEIKLISSTNDILKGKIIGTEGSFENDSKYRKETVFDGDILTFFDAAEPDGTWVGLDLGEAKYLKEIEYIFRNDDNNIHIGDTYELVYWENGKWKSKETLIAEKDTLNFHNCPSDALYLLHNRTRGSEERIFLYENDQQIWW